MVLDSALDTPTSWFALPPSPQQHVHSCRQFKSTSRTLQYSCLLATTPLSPHAHFTNNIIAYNHKSKSQIILCIGDVIFEDTRTPFALGGMIPRSILVVMDVQCARTAHLYHLKAIDAQAINQPGVIDRKVENACKIVSFGLLPSPGWTPADLE